MINTSVPLSHDAAMPLARFGRDGHVHGTGSLAISRREILAVGTAAKGREISGRPN